MTPTTATIAVCIIAELLPAPIAMLAIDRIATHMERQLDHAIAETSRLAAERDAEVRDQEAFRAAESAIRDPKPRSVLDRFAEVLPTSSPKPPQYDFSSAAANIKRRRAAADEALTQYQWNPITNDVEQLAANAEAAAYAAEEARLAAQYGSMHDQFEAIARADPHMRR